MTDISTLSQRFANFVSQYVNTSSGAQSSDALKAIQAGKLLALLQTRLTVIAHSLQLDSVDQLETSLVESAITKLINEILEQSPFLSTEESAGLRATYMSNDNPQE